MWVGAKVLAPETVSPSYGSFTKSKLDDSEVKINQKKKMIEIKMSSEIFDSEELMTHDSVLYPFLCTSR